MPERELPKLTSIIGGTSELGMRIAAECLKAQGAVVLFDSKVGDSVAELAGLYDIQRRGGGILFQQVDFQDLSSLERASIVTEGHFGRPINEIVNVTDFEFLTPVRGVQIKTVTAPSSA